MAKQAGSDAAPDARCTIKDGQLGAYVGALLKMRRYGWKDGFDAGLVYAAYLASANPAVLEQQSSAAAARLMDPGPADALGEDMS